MLLEPARAKVNSSHHFLIRSHRTASGALLSIVLVIMTMLIGR